MVLYKVIAFPHTVMEGVDDVATVLIGMKHSFPGVSVDVGKVAVHVTPAPNKKKNGEGGG